MLVQISWNGLLALNRKRAMQAPGRSCKVGLGLVTLSHQQPILTLDSQLSENWVSLQLYIDHKSRRLVWESESTSRLVKLWAESNWVKAANQFWQLTTSLARQQHKLGSQNPKWEVLTKFWRNQFLSAALSLPRSTTGLPFDSLTDFDCFHRISLFYTIRMSSWAPMGN